MRGGAHVTADHAIAALDGAISGPLAEVSVGGGTGMNCYGFNGGSGTSSRVVAYGETDHVVGVLVQANRSPAMPVERVMRALGATATIEQQRGEQ